MTTDLSLLQARAKALNLNGLLAHWQEAVAEGWLKTLIEWEEQERARRGLERRLREARIGRFKPLSDFDWAWPESCDRGAIEATMALEFLKERSNIVLVGGNGLGKTMIAQNIAHQAVLHGHCVLFTTAGHMLGELAALDSDSALRRRLRHYARPRLLVVDEVGYLGFDNRNADLLFQVVSRRYERKSLVLTTNLPFRDWPTIFPNATCATALIDRVIHHADVVSIEGKSYRLREAEDAATAKAGSKTKSKK